MCNLCTGVLKLGRAARLAGWILGGIRKIDLGLGHPLLEWRVLDIRVIAIA